MNLLSPSEFCMHLRDFEVENATEMQKRSIKINLDNDSFLPHLL